MGNALLKAQDTDFVVEELLGFDLAGHGEHVCLWVEKSAVNTQHIVKRLQDISGASPVQIGYCGLKDRRAVCRQWFSVHSLPGREADWSRLEEGGEVKILRIARHNRKLRIGSHQGNRFELRLQQVSADQSLLEHRLRSVRERGFPNYFGAQRFGHNDDNLENARAMFDRIAASPSRRRLKPRGRDKLLLSAVRSQLFNQVLAARVQMASWNDAMGGELYQFDDGNTLFQDTLDETLKQRIVCGEVHPTGPLEGAGGMQPDGEVLELERKIVDGFPQFRDGIARFGMRSGRRALRALPRDMQWEFSDQQLLLSFSLRSGSYATSLIREIVQTTVPRNLATTQYNSAAPGLP